MVEKIMRYTCECCHAKIDRPKGQESPLVELVIPVVSYRQNRILPGIRTERMMVCSECMKVIEGADNDDVVSRGVFDQVKWERDQAIQQLKELGVSLGGVAPDVVKVVRCKDCIYAEEREDPILGSMILVCRYRPFTSIVGRDDFCSYGEKREGSPAEGQHDK